jgi:hypothetical protein
MDGALTHPQKLADFQFADARFGPEVEVRHHPKLTFNTPVLIVVLSFTA